METRTCTKCNETKIIEDYYKTDKACRKCRQEQHYENRRKRRLKQGLTTQFPTLAGRQLAEEGYKYCPRCKEIKNISTDFSTTKVRSGIASHCRECSNEMSKERNKNPKIKAQKHETYKRDKRALKNGTLLRTFGITLEEYEELLAQQNNGCSICRKTPEENGKMLAVDHDHNTLTNRGLLCSSCNILIGFIEKNKLNIADIEIYLETWKNTF